MRIQRINPPGLHPTPGYHHVSVVDSGPLAFIAGQCPLDETGALVGDGDLDAQVDQVVSNGLTALAAIGSTPADVVQTTIWVASTERTELAAVWARLSASPLADALSTASTLVGVTCLGYPGQLVELDIVAICHHSEREMA